MAPTRRATARGDRHAAGFTLIEVMVVVAILAIVAQAVLTNLGALVPSTLLDAEARKLMAEVETMRSEAQLQGKVLKIELDLDQHRYRRILPAEMRISLEQDPDEFEEARLGWTSLDDRCAIRGYEVIGSPVVRDGRTTIVLDHNGFTADQSIYLGMRSEALEDLVWTIRIRGLDRGGRLVKSESGEESRPTETLEGEF